jgi:hypothetical protein
MERDMSMVSNRFAGRTRALCFLAVLAGTVATNQAAAQSTAGSPPATAAAADASAQPTADQKKQAKKDLADGNKLVAKKQFDEALPKLQAAYAVDPKPATLRSIAQCERQAKQLAKSYRSYEKLLADPKVTPANKKAAEEALAELRDLTGALKVTVAQPGAAVSIDQASATAAELAQPVRVEAGKHSVSAKLDGFEPFSADVVAEPGKEVAVDVRLKPEVKTGHVVVAEQNGLPGVHAFVDGKDMGPAPWEGDLEPGQHVVELKGDKVLSGQKPVEVTAKSRTEIKLAAVPVAPVKVHVSIATTPANATITLDGQPVPAPFGGDLDPGTHKLEIAAPGFAPQARDLVVAPGQAVSENIALVALPSEESAVRVGALVGLISLPRPIEAELMGKFWSSVGLGVQYSMIPTITFPGKDAKVSLNAIQGVLRWFPFKGAFYLGTGVGYQSFKASMSDGPLEISSDASAAFVSPQIGWLWMWKSGLALGLNFGAQIPFASDPAVTTLYNGAPLPPAPTALIGQETITKGNDMTDQVHTVAKLVGKTPLPNIDFLKIGFFF